MARPNLVQLAKQGDIDAVSTLINRSLQKKSITAKVSRSNDCLRIMLISEQLPEQAELVKFICSGLRKLSVPEINKVKIFGSRKGDVVPEWSQAVDLVDRSSQENSIDTEPHQKQSQTKLFTVTTYSPNTNRVFSVLLGIGGILGSLLFLIIPIIGWILGIFGVIGSFGLIASGVTGEGRLEGECPYCCARTYSVRSADGFNCKACRRRIVIKEQRFYRVD